MYKSYTKQSLPDENYLELLGVSLCVFNSNSGFIIENIIHTDKRCNWYKLMDKTSGRLKSLISKTISSKCGNTEIGDLFNDIVNMRNRIIHSFRITSADGKQILATIEPETNIQFPITEEYLMEFIKKNNKLSDLLHNYRNKYYFNKNH